MTAGVVSVLGCGWLGLPVAERLVQMGYQVKGSTTTAEKKEVLEKVAVVPFQFSFVPDIAGDIGDFFSSKVLFITMPYHRTLPDPCFYKEQIRSVVRCIEKSPIRFIVFASSTSVYPDDVPAASEDQLLDPKELRAKILLETEDLLRKNKHFDATILRFGGLYGGNRKIGRFLSGRKGVEGGGKPVNLVHLEDCVNIVTEVIRKDIRRETFNVCSDGHPSRQTLYTAAAKKQGLEPPSFQPSSDKAGKIVANAKVKERLGYTFLHPDPLTDI